MARGILLVDDSPTIINIIKIYLMGSHYQCFEAADGERALLLARLMPVELVIADIKMPKMDGIALTSALRRELDTRLSTLPVILLTGEMQEGLQEEGLKAGASAFLQKPVSRHFLLEAIHRLIEKPG